MSATPGARDYRSHYKRAKRAVRSLAKERADLQRENDKYRRALDVLQQAAQRAKSGDMNEAELLSQLQTEMLTSDDEEEEKRKAHDDPEYRDPGSPRPPYLQRDAE